ncbi:Crp/Fnr family transcriptional regulator [Paenibacillus sp. IB182496]|uniref:Crp/Fnr family transcriptional regulator n=1 Tax=Paenibacillus sabuli TaxID=2772509 RepID=A0A927BSI2_9BACL|nr:Crp/Fnr family transcriptional regulator [Paenibacillus sabuli]MBD2844628.1 Crp/Fnr family transcriptional regulator [Paenibacillus sabuli]
MIELLKMNALFERLTDAQLQHILSIARQSVHRAGTMLFYEKDHGATFYIVLKGSVKIFTRVDGAEKMIALIRAGDSFGELSLIDGLPRSASAQTLEDCTLLAITEDSFHRLLKEHFDIARGIMAELCRRLRDTNEHVSDLTFLDARTRVIKSLIRLMNRYGARSGARITMSLPLNFDELAQMAGVPESALRQVVRDCQAKGILLIDRAGVVLDLARLASAQQAN